jgi:hypothetical protein
MAKKSVVKPTSYQKNFGQWNFVIFLTLSLMLIVTVVLALSSQTFDWRSQASAPVTCTKPGLPPNWQQLLAACNNRKGSFSYKVNYSTCSLVPICNTK